MFSSSLKQSILSQSFTICGDSMVFLYLGRLIRMVPDNDNNSKFSQKDTEVLIELKEDEKDDQSNRVEPRQSQIKES